MMNHWLSSTEQEAFLRLGRLSALVLPVRQLEASSLQLHVSGLSSSFLPLIYLDQPSHQSLGPFELTKLSAQISELMAKSSTSSVDDPVRRSYQQKGTFKTARTIVQHRGLRGLYSGFSYHLCKF